MKQLLLMAVLATACFSAKAQTVVNNVNCSIEYRPVCIDVSGAPTSCTVASTGITQPPVSPGTASLTVPTCPSGQEPGYEVWYVTPCSATTVTVKSSTPTLCSNILPSAILPACNGCFEARVSILGGVPLLRIDRR